MLSPTYYLWHPKIEYGNFDESIISFSVTNLSAPYFPDGPKFFFQHLIKDLKIDGEVASWEVTHYRSTYHGETEFASHWKDIWKLNWKVSIKINLKQKKGVFLEEFYESEAFYPKPFIATYDTYANIIIDFKRKNDRDIAMKSILEYLRTNNKSHLMKEIDTIDICNKYYQTQIILGPFDEDFFKNGAYLAKRIMVIGVKLGGISNFDTRADNWGIC